MRVTIIILMLSLPAGIGAQTWHSVGDMSGGGESVEGMAEYNNKLYATGAFTMAGGVETVRIASFDGTRWDSLFSGLVAGAGQVLGVFNDKLYVAGFFSSASYAWNTKYLAAWNGVQWESAYAEPMSGSIYAMCVYKNELYVAGTITKIGSSAPNDVSRIAKTDDGVTWTKVGSGVSGGSINAMSVYNGKLYVGGSFLSAGGVPAYYIAAWDGSKWDSIPGHVNYVVGAMVTDTVRNVLYLSGGFDYAGNVKVNGIAMWNDTVWSALGNDTIPAGYALTVYNGDLYSGGTFASVTETGDTLNYIARWDGLKWSNVGGGTNNTVFILAVYKGNLYVGGAFTEAGGMAARNIACYGLTCPQGVGLKENELEANGSLGNPYPNPTKDNVFIPYRLLSGHSGVIKLYNSIGQLAGAYPLTPGESILVMAMEGRQDGMYLIIIEIDGIVVEHKKVIQMTR